MSNRPQERFTVVGEMGEWDRFERVEVVHDLAGPSTCTLSLGDETSLESLRNILAPGTKWSLYLGTALQMSGRVETFAAPMGDDGVKLSIGLKTRLSDAFYASADTSVSVYNTSIRDFLVKLFAPLGYTESDFSFDAASRVDVMTGKKSGMSKERADLEPLTHKAAKISPGESVFEAAMRHCERHGFMIVDHPDGSLVVYRPDMKAPPQYRFFMRRRGIERQANNILNCTPTRDWSESPSELIVYGVTYGGDLAKASNYAKVTNDEVQATFSVTGQFRRRVVQVHNQLRTADHARNKARREMTAARKKQDCFAITCDGSGYFDGSKEVQYCHGTLAEVDVEGHPPDVYFVHKVRVLSADNGVTTSLEVVRADLCDFGGPEGGQ